LGRLRLWRVIGASRPTRLSVGVGCARSGDRRTIRFGRPAVESRARSGDRRTTTRRQSAAATTARAAPFSFSKAGWYVLREYGRIARVRIGVRRLEGTTERAQHGCVPVRGDILGPIGRARGPAPTEKVILQNEPKFDQAGVEKFGKQSQKRTQVCGGRYVGNGHNRRS
jgi:hypothetical protein